MAELLHAEGRVAIVHLHNRHHPIHERMRGLLHLLLVGLLRLGDTLRVALLIVENRLHARLQLARVFALLECRLDGTVEPLGLAVAHQGETAAVGPDGGEDDGRQHEEHKPPALIEIGSDHHVDGDRLQRTAGDSAAVGHLEAVATGRQRGVAHAVLSGLQTYPVILVAAHAITVDLVVATAIVQGRELDGKRAVALVETYGACPRDVFPEDRRARPDLLVVDKETRETQMGGGGRRPVQSHECRQTIARAEVDNALGGENGRIEIKL